MDTSAVAHERWSPQQVTHLPPVWGILLPWQRHKIKGAFSVSSERNRQSRVNEIGQVSKQHQVDLNPGQVVLPASHRAPL